MKQSKCLFIVRHGETNLNSHGSPDDRIRGWKNPDLNAMGKQSAREAANKLVKANIIEVCSSDLERCKQTAQAIVTKIGVPADYSKNYRPWFLGDLQGQSSMKAQPLIEKFVTKTPDKPVDGGESFNTFKNRALDAIEELIRKAHKTDGNLCLVSHYRVCVLLKAWLAKEQRSATGKNDHEIDLKEFFTDTTPPGDILVLDCGGDHLTTKLSKL